MAMIAVGRPLGWAWLKPYALGALGHSLWLGPLLAILAAVAAWPRTRRPASIHVGAVDVAVEGGWRVQRFARAQIEGGLLIPSATQPQVELYLRGGDVVRLAAEDEAAATALLDALDIGPSERRVRVTLADPIRRAAASALRAALVILVFFLGLGWSASAYRSAYGTALPPAILAPWLAMVVGTIVGWSWLRRPTEVVVGAEGVRVVTALGERTIAYPSIEDVRVVGARLELEERGGAVTRLQGGMLLGASPGQGASPPMLLGLARRIREGMIGARSAASEALAGRLERGERSLPEWREALAQLFGGGGYRSTSLARDVAEHVLEDGAAAVDRRLGAALALAQGGPEDRARIRIAAETTTDDRLRIALLRVADGEESAEQEIEDALSDRRAVISGPP
ncbi:MAG: hypothetical protein WKG00_09220 [Polyangiaceae bacterium]